jgi:hypothetical protein
LPGFFDFEARCLALPFERAVPATVGAAFAKLSECFGVKYEELSLRVTVSGLVKCYRNIVTHHDLVKIWV